ncbi:hypothetical protein B296_00056345 [Ensete ventricosum]|uniref:Uncharacterized protein n=1 Tax=Ensete ventricosum TaxID=4639 RepID=A0A426XVI9_ENSVE|nr:hypothetical protein B296_00056345 [Ensete ventricosum]
MIMLLPLQKFMSLTYIGGKLCASAPYFIFYVDSFHTAWSLHQVPPKLFHPSICIELMVAFVLIISLVSSLLSLISTQALTMPSCYVVMGRSSTRSCNDSHCSLTPLSFVELLSLCTPP